MKFVVDEVTSPFLQGILGTRNLVHYLFRRSLNGIAVKQITSVACR